MCDTRIPGSALARVRDSYIPHSRPKAQDNGFRVIGGAIIDNDNFRRRMRLAQDGLQSLTDEISSVVRRNNNAHTCAHCCLSFLGGRPAKVGLFLPFRLYMNWFIIPLAASPRGPEQRSTSFRYTVGAQQ